MACQFVFLKAGWGAAADACPAVGCCRPLPACCCCCCCWIVDVTRGSVAPGLLASILPALPAEVLLASWPAGPVTMPVEAEEVSVLLDCRPAGPVTMPVEAEEESERAALPAALAP